MKAFINKKIQGLQNWEFVENIPGKRRQTEIEIDLAYPELSPLIKFTPEQRKKIISSTLVQNLKSLKEKYPFVSYQITGSKIKPRRIVAAIPFNDLEKVAACKEAGRIYIKKIEGARKKKSQKQHWYCVKMIIAIQVENQKKGLQTFEERYILLKAANENAAMKRAENNYKKTAEDPYLNPYGELVRWKLERIDDCYQTFILDLSEANEPGGLEVYSILKKRRLKETRVWNGYPNKQK